MHDIKVWENRTPIWPAVRDRDTTPFFWSLRRIVNFAIHFRIRFVLLSSIWSTTMVVSWGKLLVFSSYYLVNSAWMEVRNWVSGTPDTCRIDSVVLGQLLAKLHVMIVKDIPYKEFGMQVAENECSERARYIEEWALPFLSWVQKHMDCKRWVETYHLIPFRRQWDSFVGDATWSICHWNPTGYWRIANHIHIALFLCS